MSAAIAIIEGARRDGVELTGTPAGNIKFRGPAEAVARWRPALVENKAAVLAELRTAKAEINRELAQPDPRVRVEALLDAMAAEHQRRRDWWEQHPAGWPYELRLQNLLTGNVAT